MGLHSILTSIADTIRSKTGITKELRLDEMPNAINEVHEAGKQAEYDAFWNAFQLNGSRNDYRYAFSYTQSWTDELFKPKYPITSLGNNNSVGMFMYNTTLTDTKVPIKIASYGSSKGDAANTFFQCNQLKKIRKFIVDENTTFRQAFNFCSSLEELNIEGVIGQNGFDVHWSTKLNKASITSIVNALSTTTSGLSITLSLTAVNNAFEGGSTGAEWLALAGTRSNWTINLV
jgi:hypothetical protein